MLPPHAKSLGKFAGVLGIGALFVVFSTELSILQRWLQTVPLSTGQWAAVLGLALVMPLIVEVDKAVQRWRRD